MSINIAEIRYALFDRIATLQNEALLHDLLLRLNDAEKEQEKIFDEANQISPEQYQSLVAEGLEDAEAGRMVDFEAVKEKWKLRLSHAR